MPDKPAKHFLEVERQVIHLMLKSRDTIDEILDDGMTPQFFDAHHRLLVESILKEYIESGRKRLLTRSSYRQMLVDNKAGGDLMQNLTVFDKCFIQAFASTDDLGHLKKLLVEGYISRECYFVFEKFKKDTKNDGFLCAAHNMSDQLKNMLGVTNSGNTTLAAIPEMKEEYIHDLEERRDDKSKTIRCGIYPEIDDVVTVGFRPQHITLFVGDVGSHKTNAMLNIALALYDRGHSVLFIPLEMNRFDLMNRIIANRAHVNCSRLACPEVLSDDEWGRIKTCQIWLSRQNRFSILDADERTSVSKLQHEIEKRSLIFKPEVVIIDYIANLKSDRRYERNDLEIGDILKSLRFLGKKNGFHIISAAQLGRQAIRALLDDPSSVPDTTSIRGSHEYSADSDTIFGLLKVKDEPDKIKLVVIKARHGPSSGSKLLYVQPEYCLITSSQNMNVLTSQNNEDILGLESDLNEPVDKIYESVAESKQSKVVFVSSNLDDDDLVNSFG